MLKINNSPETLQTKVTCVQCKFNFIPSHYQEVIDHNTKLYPQIDEDKVSGAELRLNPYQNYQHRFSHSHSFQGDPLLQQNPGFEPLRERLLPPKFQPVQKLTIKIVQCPKCFVTFQPQDPTPQFTNFMQMKSDYEKAFPALKSTSFNTSTLDSLSHTEQNPAKNVKESQNLQATAIDENNKTSELDFYR